MSRPPSATVAAVLAMTGFDSIAAVHEAATLANDELLRAIANELHTVENADRRIAGHTLTLVEHARAAAASHTAGHTADFDWAQQAIDKARSAQADLKLAVSTITALVYARSLTVSA